MWCSDIKTHRLKQVNAIKVGNGGIKGNSEHTFSVVGGSIMILRFSPTYLGLSKINFFSFNIFVDQNRLSAVTRERGREEGYARGRGWWCSLSVHAPYVPEGLVFGAIG